MNCLTARRMLDLARGSEQVESLVEAAAHVTNCPPCQEAVQLQQRFDGRIGTMCRDRPVPAGLKERLLAALEAAEFAAESPVETAAAGSAGAASPAIGSPAIGSPAGAVVGPAVAAPQREPAPQPPARSGWTRRRAWWTIYAAAGVIAAGIAVALIWPAAPSVSLDELAQQAMADGLEVGSLPAFGGFVQPPATMSTKHLVQPPHSLNKAAVYEISLTSRHLRGRLIVVPLALVKDPPRATGFLGGSITYRTGYLTTAWTEGKFAYLCCVSGQNENVLRGLEPQVT